jgi:hypothetical protein
MAMIIGAVHPLQSTQQLKASFSHTNEKLTTPAVTDVRKAH